MSALKLHKPKFAVGDKEYCTWKAGDRFIKSIAMPDNSFFRASAYAQGYANTGLLLDVSGPGKHRRCALNAIQQL